MTFPSSSDPLFENAACGLLVTAVDGAIRTANTTFCHWLGYEQDELVGKMRIQQLFTMGGRIFHHTHWSPLLEMQGSISEIQLSMLHRDGRSLPMLINAIRRTNDAGVFDEIAVFISKDRHKYEKELLLARQTAEESLEQLRQVQRELEQSRSVLGLAMRGGRMGAWSFTAASSPNWWLSQELEELLGITAGGFTGSHQAFLALLHEEDRLQVDQAIEQAVSEKADCLFEFRVHHAGGQWRVMEARGRPTHTEQGATCGLTGVIIDITERRRAESELRQLNKQLALADRRKNEFLATLAHELRNPVAPISNALELLKQKDMADPQLVWVREVLDRQVHQITHLIDDLLDVSRITHGRIVLRNQLIDFQQVVIGALDATRPAIEAAGHSIHLQLDDHPLPVHGDFTRLVQVVSNLLANAAKYTPDAGRIHVQLKRDGETAELKVCDTGIGINPDELAQVFDMFSQLTPALERAQGGLGIGLALVRGLVDLHGGTIHAESAGAGQGSTFVVRLPASSASLPAKQEIDDRPATSQAQGRVLIIDDNKDAADTLAEALEMLGYTTTTAHNGTHGLVRAREFAADVVLLDIGLPDINGYEVARRLRTTAWGEAVLLVAVTGWGQDDDKLAAMRAGFDRHLTKPVDFSQLLKLLELPKR